MNIWERLNRIVEATPFEAPASAAPGSTPARPALGSTPSKGVRNIQMTEQELDAVIAVLENSVEKKVKGVDVDALEQKLYMTKVKKESMGSGNSTSAGDSGEIETEVERTY